VQAWGTEQARRRVNRESYCATDSDPGGARWCSGSSGSTSRSRELGRPGRREEAGHRSLNRHRALRAGKERLQGNRARDRSALRRGRLRRVLNVGLGLTVRRREGERQVQRRRDEHLGAADDVRGGERAVSIHNDVHGLGPAGRLDVGRVLGVTRIGRRRNCQETADRTPRKQREEMSSHSCLLSWSRAAVVLETGIPVDTPLHAGIA